MSVWWVGDVYMMWCVYVHGFVIQYSRRPTELCECVKSGQGKWRRSVGWWCVLTCGSDVVCRCVVDNVVYNAPQQSQNTAVWSFRTFRVW